jgi:hypothetical protein
MECIPCCLPERQGTHPWPGTAMAAEETHRRGAAAQGEGQSGEPTSCAPRWPVCGRTLVWQRYQFEPQPCALAATPATPRGMAPRLRGGRVPGGRQPASRSRTAPAGRARRPRGVRGPGLRCSRSGRRPGVPRRPRVASGVAVAVPPPGNPQRRHRRDAHEHLSDAYPRAGLYQATTISRTARQLATNEQNQPEPPHRACTPPRPGAVQCHQTGRGACWGGRP